jgi:hypothetical protein
MGTKIVQTLSPLSKLGTTLPVGGRSYHFTPNDKGDYTAEILEQDVGTVLGISAGYQLYRDQSEAAVSAGLDIVIPEEVREPAARASPPPPLKKGEYREQKTAKKRGRPRKNPLPVATPEPSAES